ncbi:hypothetical protein [Luteimonas suaedae]|uniref:hypothetical protein n=1 Tax=Luteimonas suaedae TaxID=2605430 RepID=UPI0011EEEAD2|nr:hypothetical protein [Luteimonas suaedae]
MERALVEVAPDDDGWTIRIAGYAIARELDMITAIQEASRFARQRHVATGRPTGVRVRSTAGDEMVVGACG